MEKQNNASHRFEYLGWRVTLRLDRIEEGVVCAHAELRAQDETSCRISLPTPHHSAASAVVELGQQARAFIDRTTRPHPSPDAGPSDAAARGA
jgi:hypothetical protein